MKILEKHVQKAILDYLRLKKIFCWKNSTVGIKKENGSYIPSGFRGVSDILGILPGGRFLAIEVKRDRASMQKITVEQFDFLANINQRGGLGFVASSIDDVIKQGI